MTLAIPVITTNQPQAAWNQGRASFMQSNHCHSLLKQEQRIAKQHLAKLPIPTSEQLAPGHKSEWKLWKSLNRLRTGMGRSKTNLSKWGYADTADTACECGTSEQTMQHLLRCPLLENECSLEDLATANEKALHCARAWPNIWLNSEMMYTKEDCGLLQFREIAIHFRKFQSSWKHCIIMHTMHNACASTLTCMRRLHWALYREVNGWRNNAQTWGELIRFHR